MCILENIGRKIVYFRNIGKKSVFYECFSQKSVYYQDWKKSVITKIISIFLIKAVLNRKNITSQITGWTGITHSLLN